MTREETIAYCRANSMRRTSVLGFAQVHYPLAYDEWRLTANKMKGILHHLRSVGFNTSPDYNQDPEHLKELFKRRNEVLEEQSNTKP